MKNASGTRIWMLGAFLISILAAAGVYSLLISPELDKASTARSEFESAKELNNLLDTQILAAQAAAKNVDDWKAEIAAIELDLPPTPEQSALERLLNDSLSKEGLPALSISYGSPSGLASPAQPTSTEPTPADASTNADATATPSPTEDPNADAGATGDTTAGGDSSAPVTDLFQTPVTISTAGKPASLMRFLLDMQTQNARFFTVTNFSISRSAATDATPAQPALEAGDWVISITGSVYNLFDSELSLPTKEPATTTPYAGEGVPNPFVPISGPA